jgi:hypothetical protein
VNDDRSEHSQRIASAISVGCAIRLTGICARTSSVPGRSTMDSSGALAPLGTTATDAGTVDAAVSPGGRYLYVQAGAKGAVNEYRVNPGGSLTAIGSVTVPGAVGGEGIAAS